MIRILMVGPEQAPLPGLATALKQRADVAITRTATATQALGRLAGRRWDLVVAAEALADMTGLELIRKLMALNPMVNTAVVSSLAAEAFHEASEGLGVLMPIPEAAGEVQAAELLQRLEAVLRLTAMAPSVS